MSLHDEVFDWLRGLPAWQQELYLRAAPAPHISDRDIAEVTDMLLAELPQPAAAAQVISREDLPGSQGGEDPMHIESLSEIRSVNLLAEDQTLAFEPNGLNVVYGRNGAGKTGYARILKHAGRALRRETVLANVAERSSPPPSATIALSIGGAAYRVELDLQAPAPALLGRICVADSLCAEEYLSAETEVDYAPTALASLSRLASGLKKLGEELAAREDRARPQALHIESFGQGTEVSRILASASASTSQQEIDRLATLSEHDEQRLLELRRKRAEIDAMQAPKLRSAAERAADAADRLVADLRTAAGSVGAEGVRAAVERHTRLANAKDAARLAAASFEGEPLPGVGTDAWRRLWEAAQAFAAHQGQILPPTHAPASCPLCMQELAPEARERFLRFDEFVKDEISIQVRNAEQAIASARDGLPDLAALSTRHAEILSMLAEDPQKTGEVVNRWLGAAQEVSRRIGQGSLEDLAPAELPPIVAVEAWAVARRNEAARHAALENAQERKHLMAELAELEARDELRRRLSEVTSHLAALREVARLAGARRKASTSAVSNQITVLSRRMVEADLQGALNRQLQALNFQGLAVALRSRTVRGRSMVTLRFKAVGDVPLDSVLSQGEQGRLALAMFLAEMEVMGDASPI